MQKVTTGTLTSGTSQIDADASDFENLMVQSSGTWSGNIEVRISLDGTNYIPLAITDICDNGGYTVLNFNQNGVIMAGGYSRSNLLGLQKVRVQFYTYTSGTANITIVLASGAK
jgi:hypothetical protein